MKGMIDIWNNDNECFRWCLVRHLNPVNINIAKIRYVDKEFPNQLDFKGVKSSVHKKDYPKIKKQHNIPINGFAYEDKTPYLTYTSKQIFEKHVDLLLLSNSKSSHYVLIKDFNRFMTNKTKHHGKKRSFFDIIFNAFLAKKY